MQHFSYVPSFGILGTYSPTPCGLASFSAALATELTARGADVDVVRIADGDVSEEPNVVGELVNGSVGSVAATPSSSTRATSPSSSMSTASMAVPTETKSSKS